MTTAGAAKLWVTVGASLAITLGVVTFVEGALMEESALAWSLTLSGTFLFASGVSALGRMWRPR